MDALTRGDQGADLVLIRDIRHHGLAGAAGSRRGRRAVSQLGLQHVARVDGGAVLCELAGDGTADTVGRARHDCDATLEAQVRRRHGSPRGSPRRRFPDPKHVRVGLLVITTEVAIPEQLPGPERTGGADRLQVGEGLLLRGHLGHPVPGEVLHPGAVRAKPVDALDRRPRSRCVPPVVKHHPAVLVPHQPLLGHRPGRGVPAVAVHQHDAPEPSPVEAVQELGDDRHVGPHVRLRLPGNPSMYGVTP